MTGEGRHLHPSPVVREHEPATPTRDLAMNPPPTATAKRAAPSRAGCPETWPPSAAATIASPHNPTRNRERNETATQHLTLLLEGITVGDYLTWVHDPEPHALGRELRSLRIQPDPLGDRIDVLLSWSSDPPSARAAAAAAGFPPTPEIIELRTRGC